MTMKQMKKKRAGQWAGAAGVLVTGYRIVFHGFIIRCFNLFFKSFSRPGAIIFFYRGPTQDFSQVWMSETYKYRSKQKTIKRRNNMKRAFRLTIDFTAEICEEVQGIQGKKLREFTQEIVSGLLADPCLLDEFFKNLLYIRYFYDTGSLECMEKFLRVKDEDEILRLLIPNVSPEAAFHLKTLCDPDYSDFVYEGEDGTARDFIYEQFPLFQFVDATLTGLRSREEREEMAVVLQEGHGCEIGTGEMPAGLER
jgi:hypothetical protein